jgi:hypothetical protein
MNYRIIPLLTKINGNENIYFPYANIHVTDDKKSEKIVWIISKKDHTLDFDDYKISSQFSNFYSKSSIHSTGNHS